jgi:hypothetical protein
VTAAPEAPAADTGGEAVTAADSPLCRRHLRFGWLLLCVSLPAGLVLEALHGLKLEMYLGPDNEIRRLLWTLAHAHGTLLALLNIAYGLTAAHLRLRDGLASRMLMVGAILLPAGFLAGGVVTYGGDPGPSIVLAPIGGLLLAAATAVIARAVVGATAARR